MYCLKILAKRKRKLAILQLIKYLTAIRLLKNKVDRLNIVRF